MRSNTVNTQGRAGPLRAGHGAEPVPEPLTFSHKSLRSELPLNVVGRSGVWRTLWGGPSCPVLPLSWGKNPDFWPLQMHATGFIKYLAIDPKKELKLFGINPPKSWQNEQKRWLRRNKRDVACGFSARKPYVVEDVHCVPCTSNDACLLCSVLLINHDSEPWYMLELWSVINTSQKQQKQGVWFPLVPPMAKLKHKMHLCYFYYIKPSNKWPKYPNEASSTLWYIVVNCCEQGALWYLASGFSKGWSVPVCCFGSEAEGE